MIQNYKSETYKGSTISFTKSDITRDNLIYFFITDKFTTQHDPDVGGTAKTKQEAFNKAKKMIDNSDRVNIGKIKKLWMKKPHSDNHNSIVGSKIVIRERPPSHYALTVLYADGTTIQGDYYEKTMKPFISKLGYESEFRWGSLD